MILCFYWKEVETFKEKHKIIDVPNPPYVVRSRQTQEQRRAKAQR